MTLDQASGLVSAIKAIAFDLEVLESSWRESCPAPLDDEAADRRAKRLEELTCEMARAVGVQTDDYEFDVVDYFRRCHDVVLVTERRIGRLSENIMRAVFAWGERRVWVELGGDSQAVVKGTDGREYAELAVDARVVESALDEWLYEELATKNWEYY